MNVLISDKQAVRKIDLDLLEKMMLAMMKQVGCSDDTELSVVLTMDEEMTELNRFYRGKNETTDVLSYPMMGVGPLDLIGDIVISVPMAVKQAKEYGCDESARFIQLLIHGLLHLLGYDHEDGKEAEEKMFAKEEELMQKYGQTTIIVEKA